MSKNYRKTKLYKELTPYVACSIAEGFNEGEGSTEDEVITAWQWISDRGLWKQLQGFYGRTVHSLLENGVIKPKAN